MLHKKLAKKAVALAICTALLTACSSSDPSLSADRSPRPVKVMTIPPVQQTLSLSFPARLLPVARTQLAFRVPGTVTEIPVMEGQRVQKGDLIAQMDPHDFNVMVYEWEARYSEAMALLGQANSEQRRVMAATGNDALARVELDRANTAVTRAMAGVEVTNRRLQAAQDALRYSELRAPYDGIIAKVRLQPYEQAVPGISVVTLYGQEGYEVSFDVPESLAAKIKPGQKGQVAFNAMESNREQQKNYPVEVREVARAASMLAKTYRVTASLAQAPDFAWPNLTAELTLNLPAGDTPGIAVPASAVGGNINGPWVMVIENGKARKQPVALKGYDGDELVIRVIKGGLKPGDIVAAAGVSFLENGQTVGRLINNQDRARL